MSRTRDTRRNPLTARFNAMLALDREIDKLKRKSADGAIAAGKVVEAGARDMAPVDTGELRDSSFTRRSRRNSQAAEVGFRAPYARKIHDDGDMRLRGEKRPGGRGTYWGPKGEAGFLVKALRKLKAQAVRAYRNAL